MRFLHGVPRRLLVCACLVAAGQAQGREVRDRRGARRSGPRPARRAACVRARRRRAVRVLHARPAGGDGRPAGARPAIRATPRSARRWPATCAAARGTRRSWPRSGSPPTWSRGPAVTVTAPGDAAVSHRRLRGRDRGPGPDRARAGHVVVRGNLIESVGDGPGAAASRERVASTAAAACSRRAWSTPTTTSTSGRRAAWRSTRRCSGGSPPLPGLGGARRRTCRVAARPAR